MNCTKSSLAKCGVLGAWMIGVVRVLIHFDLVITLWMPVFASNHMWSLANASVCQQLHVIDKLFALNSTGVLPVLAPEAVWLAIASFEAGVLQVTLAFASFCMQQSTNMSASVLQVAPAFASFHWLFTHNNLPTFHIRVAFWTSRLLCFWLHSLFSFLRHTIFVLFTFS